MRPVKGLIYEPGLEPLQFWGVSNSSRNRIRRKHPSSCIPLIDTGGNIKLAFQSSKGTLFLFPVSWNSRHRWKEYLACSANEGGEGAEARPLQVWGVSNSSLNRSCRKSPSPCIPSIDTVGHLKLAFQGSKRTLFFLYLISWNLATDWTNFWPVPRMRPDKGLK